MSTSRPPVPAFPVGTTIYLAINPEDNVGMVTGYRVGLMGIRCYEVTWGDATQQEHTAMELTAEKAFGRKGDE